MSNPYSKIFIALDVPNTNEAFTLVDKLDGLQVNYKVGLELFNTGGFKVINELIHRGHNVFYDAKFYDIPTTVSRALKVVGDWGVKWVTIHSDGGLDMMNAAALVGRRYGFKTLAVTYLTSSVDSKDVEAIKKRALDVYAAGVDGIICPYSAVEAVKRSHPLGDLIVVTPGIRFKSSNKNDQVTVATPKEAILAGSDYIVVGREVRDAKNPRAALEKIAQSIEEC